MATNTELAGYCAHHRVIYTWSCRPLLARACCPKPGCDLPLVRRPRASSLGRHVVLAQRPNERERLPLVVRNVEE